APYLVASALRGVLAQRLIRKVCDGCKQVHEIDDNERAALLQLGGEQAAEQTYQHGRGCQSCNYTGYKGRIGVFELLEMNADMVDALRNNDTYAFAEAAQNSAHFRSLAHVALDYAAEGITTIDEVLYLAETVTDEDAA